MFDVSSNVRKLGRLLSPCMPLSASSLSWRSRVASDTEPALRFAPLLLLALAALLSAGAAGLLLWPPGPAQAQDNQPPAVSNLRCIAETERVAFLWDKPEWSGGEATSYD